MVFCDFLSFFFEFLTSPNYRKINCVKKYIGSMVMVFSNLILIILQTINFESGSFSLKSEADFFESMKRSAASIISSTSTLNYKRHKVLLKIKLQYLFFSICHSNYFRRCQQLTRISK